MSKCKLCITAASFPSFPSLLFCFLHLSEHQHSHGHQNHSHYPFLSPAPLRFTPQTPMPTTLYSVFRIGINILIAVTLLQTLTRTCSSSKKKRLNYSSLTFLAIPPPSNPHSSLSYCPQPVLNKRHTAISVASDRKQDGICPIPQSHHKKPFYLIIYIKHYIQSIFFIFGTQSVLSKGLSLVNLFRIPDGF